MAGPAPVSALDHERNDPARNLRVVDPSDRDPTRPVALSVEGVRKSYRGRRRNDVTPVLHGVDLAVHDGERLALIGANGSGKSTLLRCCMRLTDVDDGSIRLGSDDLVTLKRSAMRKARARIGMVFQKHNLQTRLSVLSNVVHGAMARGYRLRAWRQQWAPAEERAFAMHCLDQVGMADFAGRLVRELSGGQSQRVAIARCLMQRPAVLFADEPAASLDPAAGEEVMELFSNLAQQSGLTLVYVCHDMDHAVRYADRVVGLEHGRIAIDLPVTRCTPDALRTFFA